MDGPLRQLPDEPGLHGSKEQLAALCPLSGALHMIQNPFDLSSRKIGVDHQPGFLAEFFSQPLFLQGIAILRRPAALPDDGAVHRLAGIFIPDNGRLPLVRDADGRDIFCRRPDPAHGLHSHAQHTGPDLVCVMLHPARLRKILAEFPLGRAAHLPLFIEQNTAVAGRPRVQRHYILFHPFSPPCRYSSILSF